MMKQIHVQLRSAGDGGLVHSLRRIGRLPAAWFAGAESAARRTDIARADAQRMQTAIAELQRFKDYELADIGLSRGDLTPDGLQIAGEKRAAAQNLHSKGNVQTCGEA